MNRTNMTVVMPALNEANNLGAAARNVLENFVRFGISGQLYIVDDGSTDATGELAEHLAHLHETVRVIHHPSPQGIGGSFWAGVQRADGEVVVMLPGDGENDAAEIFRYLPLLDQVDIVVPYIYNREVRTWGRRLLSILYREIIKATFGLSLNYMNGTVMYRRAIFDGIELRNYGFFYQSELLIKCIRRGYLYAEVPCALRRRIGGDSKATKPGSLLEIIRGYLELAKEVMVSRPMPPVVAASATARRLKEQADGTV